MCEVDPFVQALYRVREVKQLDRRRLEAVLPFKVEGVGYDTMLGSTWKVTSRLAEVRRSQPELKGWN
ncbi:MAG: hypothetical protein SGPRY_014132, partial [Prymnesium sp.]